MSVVSPLHVLDSQLWEKLLSFLNVNDLAQLILTKDKKVIAECVGVTRSLDITCRTIECFLLARSMNKNLKTLKIFIPDRKKGKGLTLKKGKGVKFKNFGTVLKMLPRANLTKLSFSGIKSANVQFILPPTLKTFCLDSVGSKTFKSLSLGEAKLSALTINVPHRYRGIPNLCQSFVDALVTPSADTLEELTFFSEASINILDLSRHSLLSDMSLDTSGFTTSTTFVPPPSLQRLFLRSFSVGVTRFQQVLSSFASSSFLATVSIDAVLQLRPDDVLDLCALPHIQMVDIHRCHHTIVCAPVKHLHIKCPRTPERVVNHGSGDIFIQSSILTIVDSILPMTLEHAFDWSSLKKIEFCYSSGGNAIMPSVDFSPLLRAVNLNSLSIRNDTLPHFAARDGPNFLKHFAKLTRLDWFMDWDVCVNLKPNFIYMPPSITDLRVKLNNMDKNAMQEELMHSLDWIRDGPRCIVLTGFPFIPRVMDMCKHSKHLEALAFGNIHHIVPAAFWQKDNMSFEPSAHLKEALFEFYETSSIDGGLELIKMIFGERFYVPDEAEFLNIHYNTLKSSKFYLNPHGICCVPINKP